jgi:polysaccharide export outer membrane protein
MSYEETARVNKTAATLICLALAGCQAVPAEGPLARDIVSQAGLSPQELKRSQAEVFELVDVDSRTARLISDHQANSLRRRFSAGGPVREPVVGAGDQLKIVIFEAGADGLFSTTESKQTPIDVVVQTNGMASIPYVGSIRLAGKTLEQVRQTIVDALKSKAVEPDVLVNMANTASRNVSVSGAVARSSVIPLGLVNETLVDVIARAGGASDQPYETYVNLTRGTVRGSVLLKSIIENPRENIYVQPGDQIYLIHDPRTFTILGSVKNAQRVPFGANDLNLLEAIALAGGSNEQTSDVRGYFVFRYEEPEIFADLVGRERLAQLVAKGLKPDREGRYPMVYRFNMENADSMIVGQTFPIKSRDVVYASRHPSVDLVKFLNIIGRPISFASAAVNVSDAFSD